MKIKIMPKGYDPMVAAGAPSDWTREGGVDWTPEDTERCRKMEEDASIVEVSYLPSFKWCQVIEKDD